MWPIIVTAVVAWGLARNRYRVQKEVTPSTRKGLYWHYKKGWYWVLSEVTSSDNDGPMVDQSVIIYWSFKKWTLHTRGATEFHGMVNRTRTMVYTTAIEQSTYTVKRFTHVAIKDFFFYFPLYTPR